MVGGVKKTVHSKGLRIATRCETVEQFIAKYNRFCEDGVVFIPNAVRVVGVEAAFSFDLENGESALCGVGQVIDHYTDDDNRFSRIGIVIGITQLQRTSRKVFDDLLIARALAASDGVPRARPTPTSLPTATPARPPTGASARTTTLMMGAVSIPDRNEPVAPVLGKARAMTMAIEIIDSVEVTPGSPVVPKTVAAGTPTAVATQPSKPSMPRTRTQPIAVVAIPPVADAPQLANGSSAIASSQIPDSSWDGEAAPAATPSPVPSAISKVASAPVVAPVVAVATAPMPAPSKTPAPASAPVVAPVVPIATAPMPALSKPPATAGAAAKTPTAAMPSLSKMPPPIAKAVTPPSAVPSLSKPAVPASVAAKPATPDLAKVKSLAPTAMMPALSRAPAVPAKLPTPPTGTTSAPVVSKPMTPPTGTTSAPVVSKATPPSGTNVAKAAAPVTKPVTPASGTVATASAAKAPTSTNAKPMTPPSGTGAAKAPTSPTAFARAPGKAATPPGTLSASALSKPATATGTGPAPVVAKVQPTKADVADSPDAVTAFAKTVATDSPFAATTVATGSPFAATTVATGSPFATTVAAESPFAATTVATGNPFATTVAAESPFARTVAEDDLDAPTAFAKTVAAADSAEAVTAFARANEAAATTNAVRAEDVTSVEWPDEDIGVARPYKTSPALATLHEASAVPRTMDAASSRTMRGVSAPVAAPPGQATDEPTAPMTVGSLRELAAASDARASADAIDGPGTAVTVIPDGSIVTVIPDGRTPVIPDVTAALYGAAAMDLASAAQAADALDDSVADSGGIPDAIAAPDITDVTPVPDAVATAAILGDTDEPVDDDQPPTRVSRRDVQLPHRRFEVVPSAVHDAVAPPVDIADVVASTRVPIQRASTPSIFGSTSAPAVAPSRVSAPSMFGSAAVEAAAAAPSIFGGAEADVRPTPRGSRLWFAAAVIGALVVAFGITAFVLSRRASLATPVANDVLTDPPPPVMDPEPAPPAVATEVAPPAPPEPIAEAEDEADKPIAKAPVVKTKGKRAQKVGWKRPATKRTASAKKTNVVKKRPPARKRKTTCSTLDCM